MNELATLSIRDSAQAVAVSDAINVALALSDACPNCAYAYAVMMQERTAWDIDRDWHEQWLAVTRLLRGQSPRSG
jgi:hypothetical protein